MKKHFEKTIRTRRIYNGRIVGLREDTVKLSNGVISKREIVEHRGAVAVVGLIDGKMILIRQFRKPAGAELLEIPAGMWNRGERPIDAARRELEEETGYRAGKVKRVFSGYSSPGYSSEIIHFFVAEGLKKKSQKFDEDELIDVEVIPVKKCLGLIKKGRVADNKTFIGIHIALCHTPKKR